MILSEMRASMGRELDFGSKHTRTKRFFDSKKSEGSEDDAASSRNPAVLSLYRHQLSNFIFRSSRPSKNGASRNESGTSGILLTLSQHILVIAFVWYRVPPCTSPAECTKWVAEDRNWEQEEPGFPDYNPEAAGVAGVDRSASDGVPHLGFDFL
jgi:hypothetical protein